jgi:murein DD-endopeptidase MepM/ murein hydrolase activator NlpD
LTDRLTKGQTVFLPASALLNDWDEKAGSHQRTVVSSETNRDRTFATLIRGAKHSSVPELKYPVPKGVLTSPFGFRWGTFHTGLDIAAPVGAPVIACSDGKVIFTGTRKRFRRYGNTVMLDHGKGVYTYYAHLSEIKVKKGQNVRKGQKIALVGNTGRSTGPHLHLEVRVNNQLYNPLAYIPEKEMVGTRLAKRFSESPMGPVLAKWRVPDLITLNR